MRRLTQGERQALRDLHATQHLPNGAFPDIPDKLVENYEALVRDGLAIKRIRTWWEPEGDGMEQEWEQEHFDINDNGRLALRLGL